MKRTWKTLKILGEHSISKNKILKILLDSNGVVTVINIREWFGNIPTHKGISIDIKNKELLQMIYDSIGLILEKRVKLEIQTMTESNTECKHKAKSTLEASKMFTESIKQQNTCRTCLLERQQERLGKKTICEHYNPCPSYKIPKRYLAK